MGYRSENHCIPGFNLVVLDVEKSVSLSLAMKLLKGYMGLFYTTKRHTEEDNRFRILMPLSHLVKLDKEQYKQFMLNVYDWLPFEVDRQTNQRSRKWCTNNGDYYYQDGELLDAMLFIPETKKQEDQQQKIIDASGLSNIERWFLLNTNSGSRNNMLIRYAFVLIDQGMSLDQITNEVTKFNNKLKDPISDAEIHSTILITVAKEIAKREVSK